MLLYRLGHTLRHNLWLVPLLCVLGGVGLALGTAAIDRYFILHADPTDLHR
jgi:hypothetical protein